MATVLVVACALTACSRTVERSVSAESGPRPAAAPAEAATHEAGIDDPDPEPVAAGEAVPVDDAGATVELDGVTVTVDPGVISGSAEVTGAELRLDDGTVVAPGDTVGRERWGAPAGIEHDEPLDGPAEVRWDIAAVPAAERASIVLARWDPDLEVWRTDTQAAAWDVEGDELVAEIEQFSFWTWVADVGQEIGELTGTRKDGPACEHEDLPDWVAGTVDTDEDTAAAALLTCFDGDDHPRVTVRQVNNRTFTQRLDITDGNVEWAWTWPGNDVDPVLVAARAVFDSGTTHLMGPLTETAVGIDQPAGGGTHFIAATATVDPVTVLVDLAGYALSKTSIHDVTDNPVANAFIEVLLSCGAKDVAMGKASIESIVADVFQAFINCSKQLTVEPDSDVADMFEQRIRNLMAKAPDDAAKAKYWKTHRAVQTAGRAMAVLEFGQIAFYVSDQLTNAAVGPLTWSIRGDGKPGGLGAWSATCSDRSADSNRLFRNLTLREPFTDTSRELHDFGELVEMGRTAVRPLSSCDDTYRASLAEFLPGDWGDPEAARMVAELFAPGATPTPGTGPPACPAFRSGTWVGTWDSGQFGSGGDLTAEATLSGTTLNGDLDLGGSGYVFGGTISGTVDCASVSFGRVDDSVEFEGQLSADGTRMTGTYKAWSNRASNPTPTDTGTFEVARR